ncbi:hypothetical protein [Streptomyces sp. NPDC002403]
MPAAVDGLVQARSGAQIVLGSCWTDNAAPLAYYLQQGWVYVRMVSVDGSGVLLEVRAVARDDLPVIQPRLVNGRLAESEVEFPGLHEARDGRSAPPFQSGAGAQLVVMRFFSNAAM